jgi:tetratricopeptide (TPR) repeat protein
MAVAEEGDPVSADRILARALRKFKRDRELAIAHAHNAIRLQDWRAAERRWTKIHREDPGDPQGYIWWALALREQRRHEEAERILGEALDQFPGEMQVSLDHAWCAAERQDYAEAKRRFQIVHERFADEPSAMVGLGAALCHLQSFDEADAILGRASERWPERLDAAFYHAKVAQERRDWDEALRRFRVAQQRFPDCPHCALGTVTGLRNLSLLDEAEAELTAARVRFPTDPGLAFEHASMPSSRGDWSESLRRWRELNAKYPDNSFVVIRTNEAMLAAQIDAIPAEGRRSPIDVVPVSIGAPSMHRDLFNRFESMGDNCEFGLVQRHFGCEPLGLFRWTGISPDHLALALQARLSGFGDEENTIIELGGDPEYVIKDARGFYEMHTFIHEGQMPYDRMYVQQCRRLKFLRDKLLDDLSEGSKVFIYKRRDGRMTPREIRELHAAFRGFGDTTLFCVLLADENHPNGTVVGEANGLLVGYIDKLSVRARETEIAYDSWLRLCRRVEFMLAPSE